LRLDDKILRYQSVKLEKELIVPHVAEAAPVEEAPVEITEESSVTE
jgi:hypothetical protein